MESLNAVELRELGDGKERTAREASSPPQPSRSEPRTATSGFENACYQEEDTEGRFPGSCRRPVHDIAPCVRNQPSSPSRHREELSPRSEDAHAMEFSGNTVDYGFVIALVFLVSGIVLVVIAYTIPRESKVNPDSVTARQMEKLEMYYAQLGSHLDKCIIAGLGLLTLGGMFLSIMLMVSICKGELYRRRTFTLSRRSGKTYGSTNFRMRQLEGEGRENLVECELSVTHTASVSDENTHHGPATGMQEQ